MAFESKINLFMQDDKGVLQMKTRFSLLVMSLVVCAALASLGCSGTSQSQSVGESESTSQGESISSTVSASSTSSSGVVANSSSISNSSSAFASKDLTVSDIKITNLKLTPTDEDHHDTSNAYNLTGTIENTGSQDAKLVKVSVRGTRHEKDEYGDAKTTQDLLGGRFLSYGGEENGFIDLKAGEKRDFRYYAAGFSGEVTDPVVTVDSIETNKSLKDNEVLSYILGAPKDFEVTIEPHGEPNTVTFGETAYVKNNTGKKIKHAAIRYIIDHKDYGLKTESTEFNTLWPDCVQEVSLNISGANSKPVFLDIYYQVDEKQPNTKLSDLFGIEMQSNGICKLTNKTGHYLNDATIHGYATRVADGQRMEVQGYQQYLKPGETYEVDVMSDSFTDRNVYDVTYSIDEEKDKANGVKSSNASTGSSSAASSSSSSHSDDEFVGVWKATEVNSGDNVTTAATLKAMNMVCELWLNDNGFARLTVGENIYEGSWSRSSAGEINLVLDGQSVDTEFLDGKLKLTLTPDEVLTFAK